MGEHQEGNRAYFSYRQANKAAKKPVAKVKARAMNELYEEL